MNSDLGLITKIQLQLHFQLLKPENISLNYN